MSLFMSTRLQLMINVVLGIVDWIYIAQYKNSSWEVILNEANIILLALACYFLVLNTFFLVPLSLLSLV